MKNFRKKRIFVVGISFFILIALAVAIYLLSTDRYADGSIRTMQDRIISLPQVDLTGLRELRISGGPSVHFSELTNKLKEVKEHVIIVDGLGEHHGYINERPVSFYGYHRPQKVLDVRYLIRRLFFTGTFDKLEDKVVSEKKEAEKFGYAYKEIQISSRAATPPEVIDQFVTFIENLPETAWVHFHCRHGKGRTTMMLVMHDIMINAPQVSLADIVKRQHLLGSMNLFDTTDWKIRKGTYTSETLARRKKFIEDFYAFICQRKAGGIQKWSLWRQNLTPTISTTHLLSKH